MISGSGEIAQLLDTVADASGFRGYLAFIVYDMNGYGTASLFNRTWRYIAFALLMRANFHINMRI